MAGGIENKTAEQLKKEEQERLRKIRQEGKPASSIEAQNTEQQQPAEQQTVTAQQEEKPAAQQAANTAATASATETKPAIEQGQTAAGNFAAETSANGTGVASGASSQHYVYDENSLDAAGRKLLQDEPYLTAFRKTHNEPTPPPVYDEDRERKLRWMQGFTALGKMAGIIGDTVSASKGGVVFDKSKHQGQEELGAVETEIGKMQEIFANNAKAYRDALSLYRKGEQDARNKDIEARLEIQKKLAGNKVSDSFYWTDGDMRLQAANARKWNYGRNAKGDNNKMTLVLGQGESFSYSKWDKSNVVGAIATSMLEAVNRPGDSPAKGEARDLLVTAALEFGVPVKKEIDLKTQAGKDEFIKQILTKGNGWDAQDIMQHFLIKDVDKGVANVYLQRYLRNSNDRHLYGILETYHNNYTGNNTYGWLMASTKDIAPYQERLRNYFEQQGMNINGKLTKNRLDIMNELGHMSKADIMTMYNQFPCERVPEDTPAPQTTTQQTPGGNTRPAGGTQTSGTAQTGNTGTTTPTDNKKQTANKTITENKAPDPSIKVDITSKDNTTDYPYVVKKGSARYTELKSILDEAWKDGRNADAAWKYFVKEVRENTKSLKKEKQPTLQELAKFFNSVK